MAHIFKACKLMKVILSAEEVIVCFLLSSSHCFFFFFYGGCTLGSQHQSSPRTHGKFISNSRRARVRACGSACLMEWPPSPPFKGKTRELSQRITRRRMQQFVCASCTVALLLETACAHRGCRLRSVWRKDRMFYCFKLLHLTDWILSRQEILKAAVVACPFARISRQNGHLDRHAFGGNSCSPGMELKRVGASDGL